MNYAELAQMPCGTALIYAVRNDSNGKMYVGSTVEPHRRWVTHTRNLKKGRHTSVPLQSAWSKYGSAAFSYVPLLVCAREDRNMYESRMIGAMGTYNLMKEAGVPPAGSMLGRKHRLESREKQGEAARARWLNRPTSKNAALCEKAWLLVEGGLTRAAASKAVGLPNGSFWKWLGETGRLANTEANCAGCCEQAWELVLSGKTKSAAHRAVGISHNTFWVWMNRTGKIGGTSV